MYFIAFLGNDPLGSSYYLVLARIHATINKNLLHDYNQTITILDSVQLEAPIKLVLFLR